MNDFLVRSLGLLIALAWLNACQAQPGPEGGHANRLIHSSSPYLLQHAHNPVDWYPWGEEALQKAQNEDKLLIISVGYAACHWCHVMEHESFEDSVVAARMNEQYVSIKVDREERPDIDQIYMNAAYLTNGRGGWPLNAIALPDGRPIFAGTYFPKKDWLRIVDHFANYYRENPDKLKEVAQQITDGIQQMQFSEALAPAKAFEPAQLERVGQTVLQAMDDTHGGLNRSPKFPMPNVHQFLLRYHSLNGHEAALESVRLTLDRMAEGGIYDQVGGGFARYSTDGIWKVPHFEKMLYDNAQLVSLYSEAYQLTKDEDYRRIVYESLGFIEREMTGAQGQFYSSLDADSEGEEGKFYVWTQEALEALLSEDERWILDYYSVEAEGNWEESNILHVSEPLEMVAKRQGIAPARLRKQLDEVRQRLRVAREQRPRPGLDDKALTAWNAMMIKGYVDAFRVFGEQRFLEAALKNARFLNKYMVQPDHRLLRAYRQGKASVNGFLDDYSFLIEAYVALYQATFDEQWLMEADALVKYAMAHFYDEKSQMFFYTSDLDEALITRSVDVPDNVIPAANSSMAKGLFYLGTFLYQEEYLKQARQMLSNVMKDLEEDGSFYTNWGILLTYFTHEPFEVAIIGENYREIQREFGEHYLPNAFFLGGKKEGTLQLLANKHVPGKTMIYVCQNKSCKLPQTEVSRALDMMKR